MGGQQRTSAIIAVRCERCDTVTAGSVAPALAELSYGVPADAGRYRTGPPQQGWWLQWIHRSPYRNEHGRIRFPSKDGGMLPLQDPRALLGFGPCWRCRKPSKVKAGTLIRRAERAARAGSGAVYV